MIIESLGYMALVWVCLSIFQELAIKATIYSKIDSMSLYDAMMMSLPYTLCQKCVTFWVTLIITLDPFTAALASMMAYLFDKLVPEKTTL